MPFHEREGAIGHARGLGKNLADELMKINLLVSRPAFDSAGEAVHVEERNGISKSRVNALPYTR